MMYPRLELLRQFLSDDGAIFISIDDNEQAHLKLICDEIFGANNFVAQITLVSNLSGRDYGGVARMHEYILIYRKSAALKLNLIEDEGGKFKMFDALGGFELRELRNRNVRFNIDNRPNLHYPFYIDTTTADENGLHRISLEPHSGWVELYPLESQGVKTIWRWGKEKSAANLNVNIMAKPMKNNRWMIVEKYREERKMARSVWAEKEFRNEAGTLLLKEIFGEKVFDYPKSLNTLLRILEMATDKDSIVLDAFAGSGTTAHAVINLNAADGGTRKFILIEAKEYCRTITAERVKRVGGTFRYCKLGARLFDETGAINPTVTLEDLAAYIWHKFTGKPLTTPAAPPLIGIHDGAAYYLLNDVVTKKLLATLPPHEGAKIIFGTACRIGAETLRTLGITFRQIPKDIR